MISRYEPIELISKTWSDGNDANSSRRREIVVMQLISATWKTLTFNCELRSLFSGAKVWKETKKSISCMSRAVIFMKISVLDMLRVAL